MENPGFKLLLNFFFREWAQLFVIPANQNIHRIQVLGIQLAITANKQW